jgi:hypothetical protein
MANIDTISRQTNVSGFLESLNEKYHLNLPTDLSGNSPIFQLLKQPITVSLGDETTTVLFTARGDPLDFPPFNFGANLQEPLNAIIIITISQEPNPTIDTH